jgi:hypothetical protein
MENAFAARAVSEREQLMPVQRRSVSGGKRGGAVSSLVLRPVASESGYWRVELAWPDRTPRYFGKFDSQEEALKWITRHEWLTRQGQATDEMIQPDAREAAPD